MDAEEIRKLRLAHPFKPFNLIMNDGRKLPVDKPYFLGMSEDGLLIVHSSLEGGFEWFGPNRVRGVDFRVSPNVRKRRNGRDKGCSVTSEEVVRFFDARPFVPFTLTLVNGREIAVQHPEQVVVGAFALVVTFIPRRGKLK